MIDNLLADMQKEYSQKPTEISFESLCCVPGCKNEDLDPLEDWDICHHHSRGSKK